MFFDSRRSTVHGNNGMIATSQPLAAIAGLKVLFDGGNAIDACVAAAAVLNVVEPESTGIGGDMFALVRMADTKKVVSLNGSGRSGSGASIEELKSKGFNKLPDIGPNYVSVPATVDGWETIMNLHDLKQKGEFIEDEEDIPEPEIWFHDIYRKNGSAFDEEEVNFIKKILS